MPQVRFNTDLSLGNVITIITLIVGLTAGWQVMAADVKSNKDAIALLDRRLSSTETDVDMALQRLADDRLQVTTLLTELQTDVRYLRSSVDELKKVK